ncbi:MAG: hypothetical protein HY291_21160 [Planctomycetes bacterium]|nr:hypothetical protein [Planctomycetota bacterium]
MRHAWVTLTPVVVCCAFFRAFAGEATPITIEAADAKPAWPRPGAAIVQLSKAPELDGVASPDEWKQATEMPLRFATGSNQAVGKPDARFRAGHKDGVLYLLIEFDWNAPAEPKATADKRDGPVWDDDGAEIFLCSSAHLDRPVQLLLNLKGIQGDYAIKYDLERDRVVTKDENWNPPWTVKCSRAEKQYVSEIAIPLREVLGLEGKLGEVLRMDLVRNRAGGVPPELHWSPIEGAANCRPDYFGVAVLAGEDPAALTAADLKISSLNEVLLLERKKPVAELSGRPAACVLLNPLNDLVKGLCPDEVKAEVARGAGGAAVSSSVLKWNSGASRISVKSHAGETGGYKLSLTSAGKLPLNYALTFSWSDCLYLEACNPDACKITGKSSTYDYPRTVGRKVVVLKKDTQLSFTRDARSFVLRLPIAFPPPGPYYGTPLLQKLRYRVDAGAWNPVTVAASPREILIADGLPEGPHTIVVEAVDGEAWLDGFLVADERMSRIHGTIHADELDELLTDVRAEIRQDGRIVRTEYVRAPHTGNFDLHGLKPGAYTLRFSASGWEPAELSVTIKEAGAQLDAGLVVLKRQERLQPWGEDKLPRFGQTISLQPGGSFTAVCPNSGGGPLKAALVSRFKTIELALSERKPLNFGRFHELGTVTFKIPDGIPLDMYDLHLSYKVKRWEQIYKLAQSVCVREPLPENYFLAGCGHTNTWGQETSEYLVKLAETARLAGARALLIANEVNAAYVAGALSDLSIPYVTCSGNHTLPHWEEHFGAQPLVCDDGPLRIVTFGRAPFESWLDAERLLTERADASARVWLCFEGFAPLEAIRKAEVDVIFDGHSEDEHPDAAQFPKGTLKLRAPSQQSLRWIPMTRQGAAAAEKECTVLAVPRDDKSPLRAEFSAANDGTAQELSAKIVNEFDLKFEHAWLRFVLAAGKYAVNGGKVLQNFDSDDKKFTILDVEAAVPAHGECSVDAKPAE